MKKFNSKKTSGSEAIVMACVWWWLDRADPPIRKRVGTRLDSLPSSAFTVVKEGRIAPRTDQSIGETYLKLDGDLFDEMLEEVRGQDGLGYAFQLALEEWPDGWLLPGLTSLSHAKFLMSRILAIRIGSVIKESPGFSRFNEDIVATRENMRTVTGVMES